MLIKTLGIGAAYCLEAYQYCCNLLDDTILLDCPPQAMLSLKAANFDVNKLKAILITHFDPDHSLGFPTLIPAWKEGEKKLPVIGPVGTEEFFSSMCRLVGKEKKLSRVEFVEVEPGSTALLPEAKTEITALKMRHQPESMGYILRNDEGKRLGFTGDTAWCPGLEQMLNLADVTLCEMTFLGKGTEKHLGLESDLPKMLSIMAQDQSLIITHLEDSREKYLKILKDMKIPFGNVIVAREGDEYHF
jgi:ribonuclease BN (tRNA processing enzyme)